MRGDTEGLGGSGELWDPCAGSWIKAHPAWDCRGCETTSPTANCVIKPQCEAVPEECVEELKGSGKAPASLNTWAGPPRCVLYPLLGRETMFPILGSFSPCRM